MKHPLQWILCCVALNWFQTQAQENPFPQKGIVLKTNVLHLITTLPSLGAEFQIGNKKSLQFNIYAADFVFISRSVFAGSSVMFKKYFNKTNHINGFYLGAGLEQEFQLNNYVFNRTFDSKYDYGIGPKLGLGYQKISSKKWVFDFGIGYTVLFNQNSAHASLMLGIGRQFR